MWNLFRREKVCVVDTEFTGFNYAKDRLIEVAAICANNLRNLENGKFETYSSLIHVDYIPESSTKIHGITVEQVKDAPSESQVTNELLDFIGPKATLIGHSIRTDGAMIHQAAFRSGLGMPRYTYLDTLKMSQVYKSEKNITGRDSLNEVHFQCYGSYPNKSHRALDDVHTTLKVFKCVRPQNENLSDLQYRYHE